MIYRREARDLARKLGSEPVPGGNHLKVHVYVDDIHETSFGFSHDAHKPNFHIPGDLGLSRSDTLALARCRLSREWYEELIRARRREDAEPV